MYSSACAVGSEGYEVFSEGASDVSGCGVGDTDVGGSCGVRPGLSCPESSPSLAGVFDKVCENPAPKSVV